MRSYSPLYLAGQTATGKTAVALELAKGLDDPVEIINADAFQIYSGFDLLSAAPSEREKAEVPHHLFGVLSLEEECDAAAFAKMAREKISEISVRAIPLIVGGSGLYLKALTHGLAPTPPGDPALRRSLDQLSLEELRAQLRRLDPVGAEQTNLKNRRYITRNLEICLLSGKPASELKSQWKNKSPDIVAFYLKRERQDIYDRINRRTVRMFADGVVEEIAGLPDDISPTAEKAIGLRQIRELIAGKIDEAECVAEIQQITRRFAKRQEGWFKRETLFDPVEMGKDDRPQEIAARILNRLR